MPNQPVRKEIDRLTELLKSEISVKQRFAVTIALNTLIWTKSIKKDHVPTPPSEQIMKSG